MARKAFACPVNGTCDQPDCSITHCCDALEIEREEQEVIEVIAASAKDGLYTYSRQEALDLVRNRKKTGKLEFSKEFLAGHFAEMVAKSGL